MSFSPCSKQRWRINICNIETHIPVGIHEHEKIPQRIIVNATVECSYSCKPETIDECFNYDHVRKLVVEEWPNRPHIALLETCVNDLLAFIFKTDDRTSYAKVSVCKPDIFPETQSVGVEAEWSRVDFQKYMASKS